jgi:N-acetylmuramoyl-L-alanine amidase
MKRRILAFILAITAIFMIHTQTANAIVLREGSRGTEVTRIQQRLIELGLLNTGATGIFGPATKDAVVRFQRANGLTADGVVGLATTSALFPASTSRSPATQPANSVLREGSRGAEVTRIQQRLIELRLLNTRATGVFGPATKDAVIRFQRSNGLSADGIVGAATLRLLFPSNQQANPTTNPITSTLRRGSRGAQVTALQNRLRELALLNANPNGIFGPLTQSAVEEFQRASGMTVNGIADTVTVQRLFAQPSTNPTPPSDLPEPTPPNQEPASPEPTPPAQPDPIQPSQPVPNIPLVRFHGTQGALSGRTVIIDPGHGGFDPGAVRNGVMEKDLVLDVSLRLRRMLGEAGATVLMTREADVFRSLLFRSAFANKHVLQLEVQRLQREGIGIPAQQPPSGTITDDSVKQNEQAMQALIALQIELAQIQQRQSDITAQIVIINEMLSVLNALDEDNAQLKVATEASDNNAASSERSQIFQRELQLADLAARIGLPGSTRDVANNSLLARQAEIAQITTRIRELKNQIAVAQRLLEQTTQASAAVSSVTPQLGAPTGSNNAISQAISMWNSKIAMFDHYINNPHLESREGIFALSRDSSNNVRANEMLSRVFDLTRERYQDNIVFISVHINSTTQNATDSSGIRMFYRHNGPTFAWGVGNPHYYLNYNATARRSLSQSLLNSLNAFTNFQGEVSTPTRMDFSVIRETNLVSSLIEIGFINNAGDRALMLQEQLREDAAAGIYIGLVNYFNSVR